MNNTPQLRFPGFTGEWSEKALSDFLFEHKTKSDGKCEVHSVSVTKGVINQVEYLGRSFAAKDTSKYNLAKPNDIIYTKSPTGDFPYGIVKMNKLPYNVIVSPLYAVYSPINKHIGYILDSYFESSVNTNNYLSSLVQKGAKNTINITNDTFVSKMVCLPTNPAEQQKIADCLSALDDLISAQGEKVDALKTRKKGLMQQLFPQNGETTPRLRFPGFTGEWSEKKLGEVTYWDKYFQGVPRNLQEKVIKYPYVLANVFSDIERKDGTVLLLSTGNYIGWTTEKLAGENLCEGEIVAIPWGGTANIKYAKGKFVTADNRIATSSNLGILSNKFLYYAMLSCQKKLNSFYRGGSIKHPSMYDVLNMNVTLPPIQEQQKIASCLSALDDLIASESAELEALKAHKKGLMQQLFPEPAK